jgi:hypothetical protein
LTTLEFNGGRSGGPIEALRYFEDNNSIFYYSVNINKWNILNNNLFDIGMLNSWWRLAIVAEAGEVEHLRKSQLVLKRFEVGSLVARGCGGWR